MHRFALPFLVLPLLLTSAALGQSPTLAPPPPSPSDLHGSADGDNADLETEKLMERMHPDIWLYMQERRRFEDPKNIRRRNAEIRGALRRARINSQKWYGYSASRPQMSPSPFSDTYGPSWVSNGLNPGHWVPFQNRSTIIHLERSTARY